MRRRGEEGEEEGGGGRRRERRKAGGKKGEGRKEGRKGGKHEGGRREMRKEGRKARGRKEVAGQREDQLLTVARSGRPTHGCPPTEHCVQPNTGDITDSGLLARLKANAADGIYTTLIGALRHS